jgi:6-phosphogluconolactonase (cycloisomerase 2 family)
MKFTKFGKALLMSALSVGVVLSITSCVQSYTVGFLYVTGTVTAQSGNNGIITGYKIDHNTGKLTVIHGLPVSTGGSNPIRAALITGSRFLYVLNRGVNSAGNADCSTADPCQNGNITEFAVGGNGILTEQQTYYTQGINPMRLAADSSGSFLYVLDHDAPDNADCHLALGSGVNTCADITAFQINTTTGRLQLILNSQVTSANGGKPLPFFPIPADPIDFQLTAGYIFSLFGTPATGDYVFPYAFNTSNGQLTISQNSPQPMNVANATAIDNGGGSIYVLANDPLTIPAGNPTFTAGTYCSQMLAWTPGTGGALSPTQGGTVPDDVTLCNPTQLLVESKGKFVYLANQGIDTNTTNAQSGIAAYVLDPSTHALSFIAGEPFGSGSGPQCLVEDPSDQFVYTANFNDSTVTGRVVDPNSGVLNPLSGPGSYPVGGPPTWCLVDGRTS